MNSLTISDLAVRRGDREILRGIGFTLAPGDILHLTGPNGIGKTSLLETVAGLRGESAGDEAPRTHWLGHRPGLNGALSAIENLRFWCALQGESAAGAPAALGRLGLERLRHRPCAALSTGQRRRAALARLVAVRRPLWLLDEPLAGLDVAGIALVFELMREHVSQGGAVLLSSHQPLPPNLPAVRTYALEPHRT